MKYPSKQDMKVWFQNQKDWTKVAGGKIARIFLGKSSEKVLLRVWALVVIAMLILWR